MNRLIMEQGSLFGELAHQRYPAAALIDIDIRNLAQAEADTLTAIESGTKTILEATFRHGQLRVLSDVVERLEDGSWHLIEVKSSTSAKAEHIPDLAYQRYVMEANGYPVSRCSVLHANTAGHWPDIDSYFSEVDVTAAVASRLSQVATDLIDLMPLLDEGSPCPDVIFSKVCTKCDLQYHCWQGIEKPTIYDVIDARKIAAMENDGIFYIDDIPTDYELSASVRTLVDRMQQKMVDIDKGAVQQLIGGLEYPLYHLDFESVAIATPLFDDSPPWRKYAVQYSLHIEQADGGIEHVWFLHQDNSDPSEHIARSLVENVGPTGSLVVYHKTMEKGVLMDLAMRYPQMRAPLESMANRIWDLELVFKTPYRHWQWTTRSTLKKVLPTLVPDLSYQELEIQEGGSASAQWIAMARTEDKVKKAEIVEALLRYCELDTLAMLRLFKRAKALS